jgi:hypothetical protein
MPRRPDQNELEVENMMQVYRTVAGLAALLVLVQAILAGQWIGGDLSIIVTHGWLGSGTLLLVGLLFIMSFLGMRQGLFDAKPLTISLILGVLVVAQLGLGYAGRNSAVAASMHVPLGVLIFGSLLALFVSTLPMRLAPANARSR